ncbi:MAG: hypothetical protein KF901_28640, partial [Myxococcales bacterium]|nr:hypothetical protein [Myxococcales bacterium]
MTTLQFGDVSRAPHLASATPSAANPPPGAVSAVKFANNFSAASREIAGHIDCSSARRDEQAPP